MKRISFNVAKALKEAGYPQGHTAICYDKNGVLCDWCKADAYVDAPFVMEVWLWLWREKIVHIELLHDVVDDCADAGLGQGQDPEEAIEQAIEHLVDNDLIK